MEQNTIAGCSVQCPQGMHDNGHSLWLPYGTMSGRSLITQHAHLVRIGAVSK